MPKLANYLVSHSTPQNIYTLSQRSAATPEQILVESPAWFAWLKIHSSFAFQGQNGSYTARKEHAQGKDSYWYAYFRSQKKLHKKYLGKPSELTITRLEQIALALHPTTQSESSTPPENTLQAQHASSPHPPAIMDMIGQNLLLTAKLSIPASPRHLVRRTHLTTILQHIPLYPLTLITAPAGFGKTTLLGAWFHEDPDSVAWISLDGEDDHPIRFWSYVFTALNRLIPTVADIALALLHLQQSPSIETLLTTVINHFSPSLEKKILVLDDYHLITSPAIHSGISFLLDHLPPALHLVLATRIDPPLPLARLRMHNQLLEVHTSQLRFTFDECTAFLSRDGEQDLSRSEVALLFARTEGWIAGLQLAALSLQNTVSSPHLIQNFTGSHRYIFDYLFQEVLAHQSEQVQSFLLHTSILVRLHSSLCEAILGQPGQQAMLEELERLNLFLQPLDNERHWYRYHSLFADMLRKHLLQTQPALVPLLYRQASLWCEEAGFLHEAVTYAFAIDDFSRVAHLIKHTGFQMIERGEIATLQNWLQRLPASLLLSDLRICLYEGWRLALNGQYAAAERLLQEYEQHSASSLNEIPASSELLAEQYALHSTLALRGQKNIPLSIHFAHKSLASYPQESMGRALVLYNLGMASLISGDQQGAIDAFTHSISISQAAGSSYSVAFAAQALSILLIRKGQLRRTEQLLSPLLHSPIRSMENLFTSGPLSISLAMIMREWNKLEEATALLHEGIAHCKQLDNTYVLFLGYLELARLELGLDHLTSAEAALQEIELFLPVLPPIASLRSLLIEHGAHSNKTIQ